MYMYMIYSYRVLLEVNEKQIYENLAQLVRWVDFDSKTEKENKDEESKEKERVLESIKRFQFALEEVVRLVYETQMALGSGALTLPNIVQRRYMRFMKLCVLNMSKLDTKDQL